MTTKIHGRDGWIEVTRDGLFVLAKGDETLRERIVTALGDAPGDDPVDVVADELTSGGIRRTPDFAIVDDASARALVRGSARVGIETAHGSTREVTGPQRLPWTDEDLGADLAEVTLLAPEADAAAPDAPAEAAHSQSGDAAGSTDDQDSGTNQPSAGAPSSGPSGWAMPSVFGAGQEPASGGNGATESPSLSVVRDGAGAGRDEAGGSGPGAGESPGAEESDEDDELPSFDHLFGNTHRHRSALLAEAQEDEAEQPAIDSGPVAAAGGYQEPQDPSKATLPPTEEEPEPSDTGAKGAEAPPGGLPPMPGSAPTPAEPEPAEPTPAEPVPDEAVPAAPAQSSAPDHPQFVGGHLVGARVGASPEASGPPGSMAASSPASEQGGIISAVPWNSPDSGRAQDPGAAEGGFGAPGQESAAGAATPFAGGHGGPQETGEASEASSGPMVLAVKCSGGHRNAPHATRCRICGQELPEQQPEQTPRPALGMLRLSTGDVVTLDRGVLIGRAPRAAEESGARAPHLVRISSPDNEISRNHVEVVLDGWHVLVRDLGSTNGTTVALPGSSPVRVRPGDQQTIEPGTTITLADQVSMVFEVAG